MKAVSDKKLNRAIRRIQEQFSRVDAAAETYEIETLNDFHWALMDQAELMQPGTERLVYFHDLTPAVFSQGYGIVKLYQHESWERGGSAFVYADIFSAGQRYGMTLTKSDINGRWSFSDMTSNQGMIQVFDTGIIEAQEITVDKAKILTVTVVGGTDVAAALIYTATLDWNTLGQSLDGDGRPFADQVWIPFTGGRLMVQIEGAKARISVLHMDEGNSRIEQVCGYN